MLHLLTEYWYHSIPALLFILYFLTSLPDGAVRKRETGKKRRFSIYPREVWQCGAFLVFFTALWAVYGQVFWQKGLRPILLAAGIISGIGFLYHLKESLIVIRRTRIQSFWIHSTAGAFLKAWFAGIIPAGLIHFFNTPLSSVPGVLHSVPKALPCAIGFLLPFIIPLYVIISCWNDRTPLPPKYTVKKSPEKKENSEEREPSWIDFIATAAAFKIIIDYYRQDTEDEY